MIKEYRKKRNLTQKQLASRVGVSQAYICALECGKRQNPSLSILLKISTEIGAPLSVLIKRYCKAD